MNQPLHTKESTQSPVKVSPSIAPTIAPDAVAIGIGAEPIPVARAYDGSPFTRLMQEAFREWMSREPTRAIRLEITESQWERLEGLARAEAKRLEADLFELLAKGSSEETIHSKAQAPGFLESLTCRILAELLDRWVRLELKITEREVERVAAAVAGHEFGRMCEELRG